MYKRFVQEKFSQKSMHSNEISEKRAFEEFFEEYSFIQSILTKKINACGWKIHTHPLPFLMIRH